MARAVAPAAGLVAAGAIGYELPRSSTESRSSPVKEAPTPPPPAPAPARATRASTFVTRPDLRPPSVHLTQLAAPSTTGAAERFIALAPINAVAASDPQQGLMIIDRQGRLVWFSPVPSGSPFNLNVQPYGGQSGLTWWQGAVASAHGYGIGQIGDAAYSPVKTIRAGHGLQTDLHELRLTSRGTALITAYETTTTNLSSLGGSHKGRVFAGHIQEVDLRTGRVLSDWNSLEHVGVNESYQTLPGDHADAYDYFHLNSVDELEDGNLLVCARNTCALYKVDRSTGKIIWRLNGKHSDFHLSSAARFYWQHDARGHGSTAITLIDNAGAQKERQSRGLLLSVNAQAKTVGLKQAFLHPARFIAGTLGNVQLLSGGEAFIGWGAQPYFSHHAADGSMLLQGQLPMGVRTYRAYLVDWVGHPTDSPRIVAQANPAGGFSVYASWNGATEIATWTVLAGTSKTSLAPVGSQPWAGFETAIAINSQGPYFAVAAVDSGGRELGRSAVV